MNFLDREGGLCLNYADQGEGAALLLFNGFSLPLELWEPVVDPLAADCRVVRLAAIGLYRIRASFLKYLWLVRYIW